MNFDQNKILADCIEQGLIAANTMAYDYERIYKMDGYTSEYKNKVRQEKEQQVKAAVQDQTDRGIAAINGIIRAADAAELKQAQVRAKDSEYVHRLNEKIQIIRSLAAKVEVSREEIEAMRVNLSEFENDTLSIATIQAAVSGIPGANRFVRAIPENHNGEHQANMEKLKKLFSTAMSEINAYWKARTALVDGTLQDIDAAKNHDAYALNSVTAFQTYCTIQEPDMSAPSDKVWLYMLEQAPDARPEIIIWMSRFGIPDKIPNRSE